MFGKEDFPRFDHGLVMIVNVTDIDPGAHGIVQKRHAMLMQKGIKRAEDVRCLLVSIKRLGGGQVCKPQEMILISRNQGTIPVILVIVGKDLFMCLLARFDMINKQTNVAILHRALLNDRDGSVSELGKEFG